MNAVIFYPVQGHFLTSQFRSSFGNSDKMAFVELFVYKSDNLKK